MKHIVLGSLAALVAALISLFLSYYGAHDVLGLLAAYAGFPGLLVNGDNAPFSIALVTFTNWVCYFLLFEGIAALRQGPTLPRLDDFHSNRRTLLLSFVSSIGSYRKCAGVWLNWMWQTMPPWPICLDVKDGGHEKFRIAHRWSMMPRTILTAHPFVSRPLGGLS
jgi:hypothetical protein